jgi:SAM-dependent methyltransferase
MQAVVSQCPLCNQSNFRSIYQSDVLTVVQCRTCRAVFQPQGPDFEAELNAYYASRPTQQTFAWKGATRKLRDVIATISARYPGGAILDVGSGSGEFVHEMGRQGMHAVGIEPNEAQAAYARSQGLDVRTGSIAAGMFPPASFDVITLFQVAEHLSNPVRDLATLREYLRPGGMLVVDVPSYNNPRFLVYRASGWRKIVRKDFIRPHVFYYTPDVLSAVVERAGYKVTAVHCGRYSLKFPQVPFAHLIDRITNRLKIGGIVLYAQPA